MCHYLTIPVSGSNYVLQRDGAQAQLLWLRRTKIPE